MTSFLVRARRDDVVPRQVQQLSVLCSRCVVVLNDDDLRHEPLPPCGPPLANPVADYIRPDNRPIMSLGNGVEPVTLRFLNERSFPSVCNGPGPFMAELVAREFT